MKTPWLYVTAMLAFVLCSIGASATVVYDIRMNQDGFFGDVRFSEPNFLTALTTITTFDTNTLTAPDGSLAESVVLSPLVGGSECVMPAFLSASPACFGVHFAGGASASNALSGMLSDFSSAGVYGTPGSFFLIVRAVPEPSTLFLLFVGIVAGACSAKSKRLTDRSERQGTG